LNFDGRPSASICFDDCGKHYCSFTVTDAGGLRVFGPHSVLDFPGCAPTAIGPGGSARRGREKIFRKLGRQGLDLLKLNLCDEAFSVVTAQEQRNSFSRPFLEI